MNKAVFLSYARDDADAIRPLADALRAAGVEVWFDQHELRGGEAWDRTIRNQIKECALFLPVISANTQARAEGYFRLEWKLADRRTDLIGRSKAFLVPVCIDDTPESAADVPDSFLAVQWARLRPEGGSGHETGIAALAEHVKRLLEPGRGSSGVPFASRPKSDVPAIPDYEMLRKIGSGAYGDVWLARGVTGIHRAIKVVWRDKFETAEPFEREFRGLKEFAAISLKTEGQMALLHVGRNDAAGFFYYVMELADDAATGRTFDPATYVPLTLREWLKRKGRVPADQVIAAGAELADALAALHTRGLVHRDIKPSNAILVNGRAKLADIGLVTPAGEAMTYIGTAGYVPPEGPGSPAADVFALGRVLYELATGLEREEFPKLPPGIEQLPDRAALFALNKVLVRAGAADRAHRYPDAAQMAADLRALQAGRSPRPARLRAVVVAACAALALAALVWSVWLRPAASRTDLKGSEANSQQSIRSIAVLPLVNGSGDAANDFLSDGISEELINTLSRVPGLRVIARTSSFSFRGRNMPAAEIAGALGAQYLVEGSLSRAGNRVRVTTRLVNTADGAVEAVGPWEDEIDDLFAIQERIALQITRHLQVKLAPAGSRPVHPGAYAAYLEGRHAMNQRLPDALARAEQKLREAIALDPKFAPAHAALADVLMFRGITGIRLGTYATRDSPELARVIAQIEQALALDSSLADAHVALGGMRTLAWDIAGTLRSFRAGLALNPNSAQGRQRHAHSLLGFEGRMDEALAEIALAEQLDPAGPRIIDNRAIMLRAAGRLEEALAACDRGLAVQPNSLQAMLIKAGILARLERRTEAMEVARRIEQLNPTYLGEHVNVLKEVFGQERAEQALALQTEPALRTVGYAAVGRDEEFLKAMEEGWVFVLDLTPLFFEPLYDRFRENPRFLAVLDKWGLREAHARAQEWRRAHPPAKIAHPPETPPAATGAEVPSNSIAVLPFENKSDDRANDYLADGIQEDVLTNLAGIRGLRVASEASSMRYRGSTLSIRQIGAELGVTYVLNGSLRREGNTIRLTARLVDVRKDEQVWARSFDREVSGILALQSALAAEIAPALRLALNPEEKAALVRPTTGSLPAYDLYLQGRKLRRDANGDLGQQEKAESLLRDAVAQDPGFVRAWTELATVRIDIHGDHSERQNPAQTALVQEAVEAAKRLAPDAPEVLLVLGRMHYACLGDNGGAMFYYQKVLAEYPNYPDVHEPLAVLYRKQGRWGDVVRELRTAWRLEPGNRQIAGNLKWTLRWVHAYDEADAVLREQLKLWPDDSYLRFDSTIPPFRNTGSRREFEKWFASLTPAERETPGSVAHLKFWAYLTGDQPMLFDLVKRHGVNPAEIDALIAVFGSGQRDLGLSALERLKPEIDSEIAAEPLNFGSWVNLAKYHALRGEERESLDAIERVRQLVPEGSHALNEAAAYQGIAMVLAWLGRKDEALELIRRLVSRPGFLHVWNLKHSVAWLPVRDDRRIQAIIDDPANVEPLIPEEPAKPADEGTTTAPQPQLPSLQQ